MTLMTTYKGNKEEVENGKDNVDAIANVGNSRRGDHDNDIVGQPVGASGQCVGLDTSAQRIDFSRVQPCHAKETNSKESVKSEETQGSNISFGFREYHVANFVWATSGNTSSQHSHGAHHTDKTNEHEFTTMQDDG